MSLGIFYASVKSLLAKAIYPDIIRALTSRNDIESVAVLEVFLTEFKASFDLDLFHATVFWNAVDVVGRDEDASVRIVVLDFVVSHRSFCFPFFRDGDDFLWAAL